MKLPKFVTQQVEGILQIIYPPVCFICKKVDADVSVSRTICHNCLKSLKPISKKFIQREVLNRIDQCFLDNLWVAYQFDEIFQQIVHLIKYNQMNHLVKYVASYAKISIFSKIQIEHNMIIVPVPLHVSREKERGFNQSKYIAQGLFEKDVSENILIRMKPTKSQTTLDREERKQNVLDAFVVLDSSLLSGKRVILVDDVVTTGATMNECAKVLKMNGVIDVIGVVLASPLT